MTLANALLVASVATQLVAANMGPARITWSKGVQKRIHITSFLLDQIKGMKMMGLSELMKDKIQELRVGELNLSKKYRALVSWINLMGMFQAENLTVSGALG